MTSLLSSISGFFSKSLILGTFLPVVVFITFSILFVIPLLPADITVLKPLELLETQWKVIAISFATILLAGLIYNLNIPLIRLYEGYPWKDTWFGRLRTRHYVARFEAMLSRQRGMRTLQRQMKQLNENDAFIDAVIRQLPAVSPNPAFLEPEDQACSAIWDAAPNQNRDRWKHIQSLIKTRWETTSYMLLKEYPGSSSLILPTRLGNVIRSFEYYPDREYGIDAVTIWPRLIAKVNKDYAALVDDSKTPFDFMLNGSALSACLALLILIAGLLYGAPLTSQASLISWLAEILIFIVLASLLYFQSISRAVNWGDMVKGAFDLYRGELLSQLGFEQKLKTKKGERQLWEKISVQMIYGDSPQGPRTDYTAESLPVEPAIFARGNPPNVEMEVSRGIESRLADVAVVVAVHVKNIDAQGRVAQQVVLTESLPPDLEYEWGSAHLNGMPLPQVVGINPYRFNLGDISAGNHVLLTYRAFQRRT
jgi:hypothetical protein